MRSVSPLGSTLLAVACLTLLASPAVAQPGPKLDISISPVTTTFPLSDPDTVPIIAAVPVQITYRIRQNDGPWTLTVLANGDLLAGSSTVDISNVAWVATPAPPFQNGVLSKTVAQRLASGTGTGQPGWTGPGDVSTGEFMELHSGPLHPDGRVHPHHSLIPGIRYPFMALAALVAGVMPAVAQISVEVSPLRVELQAGPGSATDTGRDAQ